MAGFSTDAIGRLHDLLTGRDKRLLGGVVEDHRNGEASAADVRAIAVSIAKRNPNKARKALGGALPDDSPRMNDKEMRERLRVRDGPHCQGCGYVPPNGLVEYLDVDHRVPKSLGGPDELHNRVLLCRPCNSVKGDALSLAELRLRRIEEGRMLEKAWTREWYDRIGRYVGSAR